jgi:hypothetical protein
LHRDHTTNGESANGAPKAPDFALRTDAWGRLVLTDAAGREHVGVEPVRAFPLSDPRRGVALCDAQGRELVWLDDLDALPPGPRAEVEAHLARREFVPVVRRVLKVSAPPEPTEWEVETDRGRTRFVLNSDEDVRRVGDHKAMITDAHGVRYLIADARALDAASRRFLDRYL